MRCWEFARKIRSDGCDHERISEKRRLEWERMRPELAANGFEASRDAQVEDAIPIRRSLLADSKGVQATPKTRTQLERRTRAEDVLL